MFSIPNRRGSLIVRVHVYRHGRKLREWDAPLDLAKGSLQIWQSEWERGDNQDPEGDDLIAVELISSDSEVVGLLLRDRIEGQLLWRNRRTGEYGCVLVDMIPVRPPGYRFAPIIHVAHYYSLGGGYENYTWLLNLRGVDETGGASNQMHVDYYSHGGARLASTVLDLPPNSASLVPVERTLNKLGVSESAAARGITAHFRGGASQFGIFVVTRSRESGAIGLEHSLPPYYFIRSLNNPATRSRVYRSAMVGL